MPVAYIFSYSTEEVQRSRLSRIAMHNEISDMLPDGAVHLGVIKCEQWMPPPGYLERRYSGVHPLIQEAVLQDPRASQAITRAVDTIMDVLSSWKGRHGVAQMTSCKLGTHRSAAVAELIANELKGYGVSVRVKHMHRRRRPQDPY
ncbi:hypothetical protein CC78DRAFT_540767 [Lojkania enalia]|uniref:RapZ C-terminal domain-containing protein n=1 Tax=Lojkania enalia TaxID=147567 RepID=A0A9P4KHU6_9PLEO|nr:hypothetical protein CC78DRAFT_540767 [Didymosphaeria enalia]